jgi:hypothetical protein
MTRRGQNRLASCGRITLLDLLDLLAQGPAPLKLLGIQTQLFGALAQTQEPWSKKKSTSDC